MDCSVDDDDSHGNTETELQHDDEDRLSELPEALILKILSLLEMKDVVKTGTLSTRWRHLWTKVDTIVHICFTCDEQNMSWEQIKELKELQVRQCISFLDQTLTRCTENFRKVYLSCFPSILKCYDRDVCALVDESIGYVLERNVEFLKLKFYTYNIPDCVYRTSSLTKLKLEGVHIAVSSPVVWPSLRSLSLKDVCLDDENECMENILSGCPVLEDAVFEGIYGMEYINVMSPRMRKLRLVNYEYVDGKEYEVLKIKAPSLQELEISGKFHVNNCQLVDVSSVVKATVTFNTHSPAWIDEEEDDDEEEEALGWKEFVAGYNDKWIDMVIELLKSLGHVDELIIGSEPIQVLSLLKLKGSPSPVFKWKHVAIESSLWKFDVPGIACLLENAPHLETLLMKAAFKSPDAFPLSQTEELFGNGDPHLSLINGNLVNLKNIRIDYWQKPWYDSAWANMWYVSSEHMHTEFFDFEIGKYMVMSAVALKKLAICSSSKSSFCRSRMLNLFQLLESFLTENKVVEEWELKEANGEEQFFKKQNPA